MISAWHLLWIVPLSASVGMFFAALAAINNLDEDNNSEHIET